MKQRLLSDVDGVMAGLMQGFSSWVKAELYEDLPVGDISLHSKMGLSPKLQPLRERLKSIYSETEEHTSIGKAFLDFMRQTYVYENWVKPLPGAIEAFNQLNDLFDIVFVTATMRDAPTSYASKCRWLAHHFPGIPVASIPSGEKHYFWGDFAVDDRWDICQKWNAHGVTAFCLGQPWSQEPQGATTFQWEQIVNILVPGGYQGEF